ncbi:hypothetical protein Pint_24723 [Pistacia integerrima]|uniref:Uncharacterized protein n=1 Tax=Pistacia integerrima TaxID=434235 RepID=A0ACC0YEL0_9ROSI|nr:hypothetical protein Pint_24723 [Pistacia integerrima]
MQVTCGLIRARTDGMQSSGSSSSDTSSSVVVAAEISAAKKIETGSRHTKKALRRTQDGSEEWGYVEFRSKAHMFWWLCRSPYRVENPSKPWLIILWLQGGPGASGVGIGNFEEVGPLDNYLKSRNLTWLRKADLLYVEDSDSKLFVKTNVETATDLTAMLEELFNENEKLQKSPLYIVAVSYGGKFAVTLGLSALKAIEDGKLSLNLGVTILQRLSINSLYHFSINLGGQTSEVGDQAVLNTLWERYESTTDKQHVLVDAKVLTDKTYPTGFLDVVSIPKTNENFSLLYDTKGCFSLHSVRDNEAKSGSTRDNIVKILWEMKMCLGYVLAQHTSIWWFDN